MFKIYVLSATEGDYESVITSPIAASRDLAKLELRRQELDADQERARLWQAKWMVFCDEWREKNPRPEAFIRASNKHMRETKGAVALNAWLKAFETAQNDFKTTVPGEYRDKLLVKLDTYYDIMEIEEIL